MEDLTIDELRQLLAFYKQRASDVEFSLLQTQIKLNKFMSAQLVSDQNVSKKETPEKTNK
jgi:hypothetical protein